MALRGVHFYSVLPDLLILAIVVFVLVWRMQ